MLLLIPTVATGTPIQSVYWYILMGTRGGKGGKVMMMGMGGQGLTSGHLHNTIQTVDSVKRAPLDRNADDR